MIDAWMSWNVPYTLDMAQRLKPYDPRWLEEPVLPDKIAQYAEIRADSVVQISGGEHEYTRYGIKELLDARAVDLMQADTYWAGGISEMQKICTLCSAYDIPIVPHGHSVPANVQLSAALSPAGGAVRRVPGQVEPDPAVLLQGPGRAGERRRHRPDRPRHGRRDRPGQDRLGARVHGRLSRRPARTASERSRRAMAPASSLRMPLVRNAIARPSPWSPQQTEEPKPPCQNVRAVLVAPGQCRR